MTDRQQEIVGVTLGGASVGAIYFNTLPMVVVGALFGLWMGMR